MRKRIGLFGAVLLAVMMVASVAVAASGSQPSKTDSQQVYWFADETDTGGRSHLTRTSGAVMATVEADGLVAGDAHTLWWVVFNNPKACSDGVCGEDDIFLPNGELNEQGVIDAGIGIGNATGNIAKADGTAEFGARLGKNDSSGAHQIVFPAGLGEGDYGSPDAVLTVSGKRAEVHVIVQTHGQALGLPGLLDQLTYLEANCNTECVDIQFAVHQP